MADSIQRLRMTPNIIYVWMENNCGRSIIVADTREPLCPSFRVKTTLSVEDFDLNSNRNRNPKTALWIGPRALVKWLQSHGEALPGPSVGEARSARLVR